MTDFNHILTLLNPYRVFFFLSVFYYDDGVNIIPC